MRNFLLLWKGAAVATMDRGQFARRACTWIAMLFSLAQMAGVAAQTLPSQPHGEGMRGLSPATVAAPPSIRWQKTLPRGIAYGGITFSDAGAYLYFLTGGAGSQGVVYKVRSADGVTVWTTDPATLGFGTIGQSGVTIDEKAGRLYTAGNADSSPTGQSFVAALSIKDGSLIWKRKVSDIDPSIGSLGRSNVLLSPDRTRLYLRDVSDPSNIVALDAATGAPIWAVNLVVAAGLLGQTVGPAWTDPITGKTRIAFVNDSNVRSAGVLQDEGTSASIPWSANLGVTLEFHWWGNGSTNLDNSRLYVTSFARPDSNPALTSLDTETGFVKWQLLSTAENGLNQYQNVAVGADGTIYSPGRTTIGSGGGLTAINPDDGTIKWQFAPDGSTELTTWPTVTSNGVVYVSDNNSHILYAIQDNGASASQLWQFQLSWNSAGRISPGIGPDGTLYIGDYHIEAVPGTLYAFGPPAPLISSISPSTTAAGGPAFSLTVRGTNFANGATVQWNGAPRTTAYLSSTQLSASILAADITAPGSSLVTVANPSPGGGPSNPATFAIVGVPRLAATVTGKARASGLITLDVTLTNNGTADAHNVKIASATLGGVPTSTGGLPQNAWNISSGGGAASTHLTFSGAPPLGVLGAAKVLQLNGVYDGGSLRTSIIVVLP